MTMTKVEINEKTPAVRIGAYGTLRLNRSNYKYLLHDQPGVKFIGTTKTEPLFTMYGKNSGFPIVSKGTTPIEVDVFEITDQRVLERVHRLEGFTGVINHPRNWYDIKEVQTKDLGPIYIYYQENYQGHPNNIIETGIWTK